MILQHTGNHFAGAIFYRWGEDGWEYLVIEYDSGLGIQIKFPGGTNNDHPGERMVETLNRETLEETGLIPVNPQVSHVEEKPGRGGKPTHLKVFFAIDFAQCVGQLRTVPKLDDGDRLSPPFWRTADELRGVIFYTHAKALEAVEARMS